MRVLIFLVLIPFILFPQNKIVKVLGSNLFELDNGLIVKMAGVETPAIMHPDSRLREIGKKAQTFVSDFMKGPLNFESASDSPNDLIKEVYITRRFTFYTEFYNKLFLERGFGKYTGVRDTLYASEMMQAEKEARESKMGIWKFINDSPAIRLDTVSNEAAGEEIISPKEKSILIVPLETLLGGTTGFIGGLVTAIVFINISGASGWDALGVGLLSFYPGYVLSSSMAVYEIGKEYNPGIDFGTTLLCSMAGASAAIGIWYSGNNDLLGSEIPFYSSLLLPLAGSILYVNLAPETKKFGGNQRDIVNLSTVSFELFRIRF